MEFLNASKQAPNDVHTLWTDGRPIRYLDRKITFFTENNQK